jgi:proteasome lid subunit RPN8/RPN11
MVNVESGENGSIVPTQRKPSLTTRPFKCFGKPEEAPVQVVIYASALRRIEQHLASNVTTELGGVLVGEVCVWEDYTWVEIHFSLSANTPTHGPVHFTFTADTWIELTQALEDQFPEHYMVGWYHSHPRLGVFFSGQDSDVHRVVFNQPWHVALVIDPSTGQAGFFGWVNGRPARFPGYYVLEDSVQPQDEPQPEEPPEAAEEYPQEASAPDTQPPTKTSTAGTYLLIGSSLLLMAAVTWMFAQIESLSRDLKELQRQQAEFATELAALSENRRDGVAPISISQSTLLVSGLTMSIGGDPTADGAHVPRGSEADFEWTVSNRSPDPVSIQVMGLQVIADGVERPDLFVPSDGSIVLPARLEPGDSVPVRGHSTFNELGSYMVSVVVLTPGDAGWQTLPADDGLPVALRFQVVSP